MPIKTRAHVDFITYHTSYHGDLRPLSLTRISINPIMDKLSHVQSSVGEIVHRFSNFNGCNVEVWEWISDFIPHFTVTLFNHQCKVINVSQGCSRSPGYWSKITPMLGSWWQEALENTPGHDVKKYHISYNIWIFHLTGEQIGTKCIKSIVAIYSTSN